MRAVIATETVIKNPTSPESNKERDPMVDQALKLLNEAATLLGKEPPPGQFDAYPQYLKAKDIADILQVSDSKALKIMHEPDFPLIRLGRSMRVEREQFFQWIRQKGA